ncbi:MAG: bifunctional 3-demethylubiquinol 3-O-methyltransferase/2-polyprenyl-6-hydroxyphenol methylase [Legionellales bacterium]|nr:bifunctional 3-demethylubiquinol 3-O-methyltransferase/2-polyprenyl-6-hydroxyphenol methylase [Legionellales bacterium]
MPHSNTTSTLKHFDHLARHWWNPDGPMKTLHQINPIRTQWISNHLTAPQQVCDIACGAGLLTEALDDAGHHMTGIDASPSLIQVAQAHAGNRTINYHHTTVESFAAQYPEHFDAITCLELLEHVDNPQRMIQHCATCCKPGGLIFLSTLNRTLKAFILGIVVAEHLMNWVPKHTHQYEQFIRPSELKAWAHTQGLQLKDLMGLTLNPWTGHAALSKKIDINYLMCFKKPLH